MTQVSASFENIDLAQTAAVQLRDSLKTLSDLRYESEKNGDGTSDDVQEFFNESNADTRFGDYFNYGFYYNSFSPFDSPYNARFGYFEPQQGSATRLYALVDAVEIKACKSVMMSHGGTKINIGPQ